MRKTPIKDITEEYYIRAPWHYSVEKYESMDQDIKFRPQKLCGIHSHIRRKQQNFGGKLSSSLSSSKSKDL